MKKSKKGRKAKSVPFLRSKTWKDLREAALERDGRKCVLCDCTERLNVHHIFNRSNYPDMKTDIDNLITLCPAHHAFGPLSVHRGVGAYILMEWLQKNRPETYAWLLRRLKNPKG